MPLYPLLSFGDGFLRPTSKDWVEFLQEKLLGCGYLLLQDGYFGVETERCLTRFQSDCQLVIAGKSDMDTWELLIERSLYLDSIKPKIISRKEWGALPPSNPLSPIGSTIRNLVLHHEGGVIVTDEVTNQHIKNIQIDQQKRGFCDIAYSYLIGSGKVFEGRGELFRPASQGWANYERLSVMIVGNYDLQDPQEQDIAIFVHLAKYLNEKYRFGTDNINGHEDFNLTDCPGNNLYDKLPEIRKQIGK